jgi:hypothetical protein
VDPGFAARHDGLTNGMSPAEAFETGGAASDPFLVPEVNDMTVGMKKENAP